MRMNSRGFPKQKKIIIWVEFMCPFAPFSPRRPTANIPRDIFVHCCNFSLIVLFIYSRDYAVVTLIVLLRYLMQTMETGSDKHFLFFEELFSPSPRIPLSNTCDLAFSLHPSALSDHKGATLDVFLSPRAPPHLTQGSLYSNPPHL